MADEGQAGRRGTTARTLAEWREERGVSLRALAERSGVHYTTISEVERGQRQARYETAVKLSRALRVDPGRVEEFRRAVEATQVAGEREILASPPEVGAQTDADRELFGVGYEPTAPGQVQESALRLLLDTARYLVRAGRAADVERVLREVLKTRNDREERRRR